MKTNLWAHLYCLILAAAFSNPIFASTSAPMEVHYHMITEIAPNHREVRFAVALKLSPHTIAGNDIGWQLDEISLRQPQNPTDCPRTWSTTAAIVKTSDSLWWISHTDSANPAAAEFDVPPWIEGTATSTDPAQYDDLLFDIEGVPGTHAVGRVRLNYQFQIVSAATAEEEDDDDEEEDTEGPDTPPVPPEWPDFNLQIDPYDLNQDGVTNGRDIEPFIQRALSGCDYDFAADGPCFVSMLLGETCTTVMTDCNNNGRRDDADILLSFSQDCNKNGIPDECDLASGTSTDLNADNIIDDCNPDCNQNGVPDDKDFLDGTSTDTNTNGVPDSCDPDCNNNGQPDDLDIALAASYDCDGDGIPDECSSDCNGNGIADICDIDTQDPDGDGIVASDCNSDGIPDTCNLTLPAPFTSFDCNANGIPDECDIADCETDLWCQDCNLNGVPDGCDIGSGASQDNDSNAVPDECESQQMNGSGGGGGSMMMAGPMIAPTSSAEFDQDAARRELLDWAMQQRWGDNDESSVMQFNRYVQKCQELGIDVVAMKSIF